MDICLIDTSIFDEILNIPGKSQCYSSTIDELDQKLRQKEHLFLPMATILECGNHIAQIGNGTRRRGAAERFIIEVRKALTDEWHRGGIEEGIQHATLTDIITRSWSGKTTKEYKSFKGLKKESLRDNMTNIELALNTLAEASTTELSKNQNPKGFAQNAQVAKQGGSVAKAARDKLESQLGRSVISSAKADDYLLPNQETESED